MKQQRIPLGWFFAPVFLIFFGPVASGAVIQIVNPGFEQDGDVIPGGSNPEVPINADPGDFTWGPNNGAAPGGSAIPGWEAPFAPGGGAGIFNPIGSTTGAAHSGNLVAFSGAGGWITQWLTLDGVEPVTAEPGAVVDISGWFSNRFSDALLVLRVALRVAPNDDVAPAALLAPLPDTPEWTEWTATFTLPDAATLGGNVGAPLFVVLELAAGGQILLDDIGGTYTVVPEPSVAALVLTGLAGLWRRRKA